MPPDLTLIVIGYLLPNHLSLGKWVVQGHTHKSKSSRQGFIKINDPP
jgi:hypothetical protein